MVSILDDELDIPGKSEVNSDMVEGREEEEG